MLRTIIWRPPLEILCICRCSNRAPTRSSHAVLCPKTSEDPYPMLCRCRMTSCSSWALENPPCALCHHLTAPTFTTEFVTSIPYRTRCQFGFEVCLHAQPAVSSRDLKHAIAGQFCAVNSAGYIEQQPLAHRTQNGHCGSHRGCAAIPANLGGADPSLLQLTSKLSIRFCLSGSNSGHRGCDGCCEAPDGGWPDAFGSRVHPQAGHGFGGGSSAHSQRWATGEPLGICFWSRC